MEGTGQNEVVVCRQLAQAGLELALVDETAGFVYDDEGEHGPDRSGLVAGSHGSWVGRTS